MITFIIKRLLYLIPTIIGVSLLIFVLSHLVPSDPARLNLGINAREEQVEQYREEHGLNDSLPMQYVKYMKNLMKGDFGYSLTTERPVKDDLRNCLPATIELVLFSIVLSTIIGIVLGVLSAINRNGPVDHILRAVSVAGVSFPVFWLGIVLLLIFYVKMDLLPGSGRIDPRLYLSNPFPEKTGLFLIDSLLNGNIAAFWNALKHLILPAFCLSLSPLARIVRVTRTSVLEVLGMDYILSARAKGLRESVVILKHGLRNALNPIITIFFLTLGYSLSGAVLIEKIFAWPGMGRYAFMAASSSDYPAIQGVALFVVIAIAAANLLADIAYAIADPQVRLE